MEDYGRLAEKALGLSWRAGTNGFIQSKAFSMHVDSNYVYLKHKESEFGCSYGIGSDMGIRLANLVNSVLIEYLLDEMEKEGG